ncbi:arylformamidase [Anthocerotibacter panamensis]|uniref:arylformamidase n=1 Tax=Anthocerotibacter panamensis TaxID=2857077 RepID=UPI001C40293A|nr:arylformamidase [Anthocerotibacter panamensis]
MQLWDISPALRPGIPVWPGDTCYQEVRTWQIAADCPVNVSQFTMSTHTGSHADAPLHYDREGIPVGSLDLSFYLGRCRLVDVTQAHNLVQWEHLAGALTQEPVVERLLLRTYRKTPLEVWDATFTAIAPATIDRLAHYGVRLIGVDTPSLDPQNSKTMAAHQRVRQHGMAILEGLVLDGVPPADYELIALPLKLAHLDAAPVRAVLRSLPE